MMRIKLTAEQRLKLILKSIKRLIEILEDNEQWYNLHMDELEAIGIDIEHDTSYAWYEGALDVTHEILQELRRIVKFYGGGVI